MYSREDKLGAVELFIKCDFSPQPAINELGHPCRVSLYNRCKEYLANGSDIPDSNPYRRCGEGLKRVAVDHYFEYGKCTARICRAPGYPSKELLTAWIDELEPGRRKVNRTHRGFGDDDKENAVVRLVTGKESTQSIADDIGAKCAALCNWKRKLLGEGAPTRGCPSVGRRRSRRRA